MRCFNFSDGKELWKFSYDAPGTVMFPGSRSVPIVDGNYVYSCGHNGDLYCINIKTHKPVWNKNIWTDFGISGDDQMASRIGGSTQNWAPLALADGRLLIRDQSRLMCVKVAK